MIFMKNLTFAIALLPFAALMGEASPLADYEIVGQFTLQQIGNEITGNFTLTQTDTTNSYDVLDESDRVVGDFQLTETDLGGSFSLQQESNDTLYLVESGNEVLGSYTLVEQESTLSGNYQLGVQAPEPGSWFLAAAGVGCLLLRRGRAWLIS